MQRAIHSRFFGIVYRNPQQSNVLSSVKICINNINFAFVVGTLKHLVCPLADMFAARTSLRSVSRFYSNQFNTVQSSLVSKEGTQLTKRPTTKFSPKLFVSPFGSKADISQILNGNTLTLFFSRLYNAFCDSVIDYGSCCPFLAREPFQKSFRTSCAFALNGTTNLLSLLPIGINPIGRMFNTIRSNDNVCQTEVNSDKILDVIDILFGNINGLKKVKLTLLVNQISFAFNVGKISSIMANKVNLLPTTYTPQGNYIVSLISHNTTIISDTTKWSKSTFGFLVQLIGISNFCNRTYQTLGGKFKCCLIFVVNFVMELEIVKHLFRPSNLRNSITDSICFPNSFKKQSSLFNCWKKFDFQGQFHNSKMLNISDMRKYINLIINQKGNLGQFLPLPKGEGVSLLPIT